MKLFTLILATTCLLAVSTVSFAQVSFMNVNTAAATTASIKFNPMGIANGVVKVKMFGQPSGTYTVQVMDENGKVLGVKQIQHDNNTTTEIADFGRTFTGGTYQLEIIDPGKEKTNETIMLLM